LPAGDVLSGVISSEHLLQITSEDFVTCGVDERIDTETEMSEYTGQRKSVAIQAGNLTKCALIVQVSTMKAANVHEKNDEM